MTRSVSTDWDKYEHIEGGKELLGQIDMNWQMTTVIWPDWDKEEEEEEEEEREREREREREGGRWLEGCVL